MSTDMHGVTVRYVSDLNLDWLHHKQQPIVCDGCRALSIRGAYAACPFLAGASEIYSGYASAAPVERRNAEWRIARERLHVCSVRTWSYVRMVHGCIGLLSVVSAHAVDSCREMV